MEWISPRTELQRTFWEWHRTSRWKSPDLNCGRFEREISNKYGDTDGEVSAAAAEDDSCGSSSDSWTVSRRQRSHPQHKSALCVYLLKITPKLIEYCCKGKVDCRVMTKNVCTKFRTIAATWTNCMVRHERCIRAAHFPTKGQRLLRVLLKLVPFSCIPENWHESNPW